MRRVCVGRGKMVGGRMKEFEPREMWIEVYVESREGMRGGI